MAEIWSWGLRRWLICGDRNWSDQPLITAVLTHIKNSFREANNLTVIHGDATGADTMAGIAATKLGFKVEVFRPEWRKFGRAAGPIRNQQMLSVGKPDFVIAFHDNIEASKGTKDMVKQASNHVRWMYMDGKKQYPIGAPPILIVTHKSHKFFEQIGYLPHNKEV